VICIGIVNFKSRVFWVGFSWLGVLAGTGILLSAFFGPLLPNSGFIYPVYIVSILSVLIVWSLAVGISLLSKRRT
jgi:hypothetical protein